VNLAVSLEAAARSAGPKPAGTKAGREEDTPSFAAALDDAAGEGTRRRVGAPDRAPEPGPGPAPAEAGLVPPTMLHRAESGNGEIGRAERPTGANPPAAAPAAAGGARAVKGTSAAAMAATPRRAPALAGATRADRDTEPGLEREPTSRAPQAGTADPVGQAEPSNPTAAGPDAGAPDLKGGIESAANGPAPTDAGRAPATSASVSAGDATNPSASAGGATSASVSTGGATGPSASADGATGRSPSAAGRAGLTGGARPARATAGTAGGTTGAHQGTGPVRERLSRAAPASSDAEHREAPEAPATATTTAATGRFPAATSQVVVPGPAPARSVAAPLGPSRPDAPAQPGPSAFAQTNTALTAAISRPQKLGDGAYQVRAALDPPALGPVDAVVKVDGSTVQVNLVAHTAAGHQELAGHLDELRRTIGEQTGGAVEITLTSGADQSQGHQARPDHAAPSGPSSEDDAEPMVNIVPVPSSGSSLHVIL
jgi:hypothetical protein